MVLNIRITNLVFTAPKRPTKKSSSKTRMINQGLTTKVTPLTENGQVVNVEVTIVGRHCSGTVTCTLFKDTGRVTMYSSDVNVSGPMKHQGYEFIGYTVDSRVTNTNRRHKRAA